MFFSVHIFMKSKKREKLYLLMRIKKLIITFYIRILPLLNASILIVLRGRLVVHLFVYPFIFYIFIYTIYSFICLYLLEL